MAARIPLPNGSTFDIAVSLTEIEVTAVSNASPAVATANNDLVVGDVVLLESGWSKVNGRAARLSGATATTMTLEGINTADVAKFPARGGVGSAFAVDEWTEITKITGVASSGGEQQMLDVGYLAEDEDRQYPTNKTPLKLELTVEDQPRAFFTEVVRDNDETKEYTVLRLNLPNGDQIIYPCTVSITAMPSLARGELMVNTISVALSGRPIRYYAA